MSEEKDIKQKAIAHYNRMIKFARECKESEKEFPNNSLGFFYVSIGEYWQGDWCSYCSKYCYKKTNHYELSCRNCPLNPHESKDPEYCCGGLWNKIGVATTWEDLIKALTDVKNYIEMWG